jgi:hypothetical protein
MNQTPTLQNLRHRPLTLPLRNLPIDTRRQQLRIDSLPPIPDHLGPIQQSQQPGLIMMIKPRPATR